MGPIARLSLTDFRNYRDGLVEPGPGFVILTGPNGAGKTNILEAVSLLTPGRGLRQVPISDMARSDGPGGFAVAARLVDGTELGTGTTPVAPDRRQVRINGAATAVNSLSERLAVLWLTPAMDRLFTDSAGARRRFLDRLTLALEPGHATHAARYEAAMRARNKLLGEPEGADPAWLAALEAGMAEHGQALAEARSRYEAAMRARNKLLAEERWDDDWLASLEAQMAEHGLAVSAARMSTAKSLSKAVWADESSDFPKATLEIENVPTTGLKARLAACRKIDAAARRATHGPNNEDLKVYFGAKERLAAQCSTGEQKALLLGLVLAHAELVADRRGASPILLLDEVAAHLDPGRRAGLFARLDGRGQVWMTGTEPSLFDAIGTAASRFHVESGTISAA